MGRIKGMNTATDTLHENTHDTKPHVPSKGRSFYLGRYLLVFCGFVGAFATLGWILGFYERVSPEIIASSLLLSLVAMLGWPFAILLSVWPQISLKRRLALNVSLKARLVILLGTAICWGGPLAAWYLYIHLPLVMLRDLASLNSLPLEEVRSLTHRILVWNIFDPHDEFINLTDCGDKSSVPYAIWGLQGMPDTGIRMCTWGHGLDALNYITNHAPGRTREKWSQWYAANKGLTQQEWWISGFVAEGYSVTADGKSESIQNLFRAMGQTPLGLINDKPWLTRNAKRLLATMDQKTIRRTVAEVVKNGSVQEQRGVAHYVMNQDCDYAEPILHELVKSDRRTVRLLASNVLNRLQEEEWLENPPGYLQKQLKQHSVSDDEFFTPPDAEVIKPQKGIHATAYEPPKGEPPRLVIQVAPEENETRPAVPACVIRIDWHHKSSKYSEKVATLHIEGIQSLDKKPVYSKELTHSLDVYELRWLYDPAEDSVYISVPCYTCKVDRKSGRVIWEIGYGTDNLDELLLLKNYLIIRRNGNLVLYDASNGKMLARYTHPNNTCFDRQITLVDGQLRAKDFDGVLYIRTPPRELAAPAYPKE